MGVSPLPLQPEDCRDDGDGCKQRNQRCDFIRFNGVAECLVVVLWSIGPYVLKTQRTTQLLSDFATRRLLTPPHFGIGGQSKCNNQDMARVCQRRVDGWLSGCGKTDTVEGTA